MHKRFPTRTGGVRSQMSHVVEGFVSNLQARIAAAKQRSHVGRNQSIRHPIEDHFAFDIAQVKSARGVQINNLFAIMKRTNASLPAQFKRHKFHRNSCLRKVASIQKFSEKNDCLSRRAKKAPLWMCNRILGAANL